VIERGSTAQGEFVRFAGGTQICWHVLTPAVGGPVIWTYPAAFAGPVVLTLAGRGVLVSPEPRLWMQAPPRFLSPIWQATVLLDPMCCLRWSAGFDMRGDRA
jgi:hypothetical protein